MRAGRRVGGQNPLPERQQDNCRTIPEAFRLSSVVAQESFLQTQFSKLPQNRNPTTCNTTQRSILLPQVGLGFCFAVNVRLIRMNGPAPGFLSKTKMPEAGSPGNLSKAGSARPPRLPWSTCRRDMGRGVGRFGPLILAKMIYTIYMILSCRDVAIPGSD